MLKLIVKRGSKYWGRNSVLGVGVPEGIPSDSHVDFARASSRSLDESRQATPTRSDPGVFEGVPGAEPTPRPSPDGKWLRSRSKRFRDKNNFEEMYENAESYIKAGRSPQLSATSHQKRI